MKLRNLTGAVLAFAGVAFGGTAFADGSIWDIVGESLTKPADDPYRASETIRFRMRLVSPTYDQPEADREVWSVQLNPDGPYAYCIGNPSLIAMVEAMAPLKLGIVARGVSRSSLTERVAGAVLEGMAKPSAQKQLTELTFVYTTRCGDFALPLRAAADGEGHALGDASAGERYFFQNGPGDTGNEVWSIVTTAGTAFVPTVSGVAKAEIDCDPVRQEAATGGDFLRKLDYNVVTMDFDSREAVVDDKPYWRAVNEGSKSSKVTESGALVVGEPRICTYDETTSPASADLRLYAWVAPGDGTDGDPSSWTWGDEAGYAVRIAPGTSARTQTFEDPDGVSRAHTVYEFAIVSNRVFYGFELEGQHRGKAARVVLSRTPQYNWVGDSGSSGVKTLLVDFLAEPVLCIEPEAPTISVTIDGYGNPAEFDCAFDKYTQGHALQVRLNTPNPSNDAMKVQLKFALGDEEGFPTNIIAVSEDAAGGFSKNPLAGMEVSIPPGAYFPERPVYLFVLGATGETAVPPGITVTPVPEGRFASFVETTNSQYVVIRGMEPVVVKPSGTQESPAAAVTVSCGTPHLFAITIDDSYRNLHLLDGTNGLYTVTWERGIGKTLTITNDINGKPLVPDAYGRLNIGVTYPVSSTTNQYLSSFSVRNPEGLSSADSYITVKTRDPDYVVAETLDGSTEAMESDDEAKFVNLRFRLVPDAAGAVDYDKLYAFLEPLNAAASNCTSASFLTTAQSGKSRGVKLVEGVGTTDANEDEDESEPTGGLQILDGDGKSTARFNVVLCTAKAWDSGKRVGQYASKSFSLKLLNFKPAVSQVKITDVRPGEGESTTEKNYYVVAGGTNSTPIQTGHDIKLAVRRPGQDWNGDVAADLFATTNRQVVLRWVVYEVGEDGATSDPYAYGWEVGTNSVFTLDDGFDDEGIKKIVVQVQDKDMRDARCVVEEDGKWKYYMDPDDHEYQEWQMDENGWGDEFTFYIRISDQPTIDLLPVGNVDEYRSQPLFSEGQLAPFSVYDKDLASKYDAEAGNVGFKVMLSDKYNSQDKLTLVAWVEGPTNSVQLAVTNVVGFKNARQTTAKVDFPIAAFDGTYASQGVPDKYTVKARVVKAGSDTGTEATNHYVIGSCDFYVRNEAPLVFLTDRKQLASDGSSSNDTIRVVKNQHITVPWRVEDVGYDLTNATKGVTVTCTTSSGGTVVGSATTNVVGAAGAISGSFEVYFSGAGSNWVLIEAKDKDEDIGEARTCFEVEANKNVFVYPTRPFNSSLGSDVISDYLRSPGYGYVWANGTLGGIENFMQTWTYGIASGSAIVYASGYTAGEKETVAKAASKNKAFVDANGGNVEDDTRAYVCPLSGLDSFFYRWIVKSISEGGGSGGEEGEWSAKVPDPQISTNAADRVKQYTVDLPREQKDGVFADAAVMAVFAREYLWSDNLGDINQDGVPDVYVLQYKLTDGNYDAGADMKDVNFGTDGKTPYCQDYLPLTEFVRYSKLIPELTEYANIENAQAFTPRLKIRGYDDNLNDATAAYFPDGVRNQAFVDGAAPERRYEMEDGSWSAASCTVSYVEHLAWKAFEATHPGATFADWSPERPTDPTKADTDNDGFTDGYEYYWWYRAHVGYLAVDANGTEALRKATGRAYDPRNPGEGRFLSTEEIERTFDPLTPIADITQDTDQDGLPDLLEFEIGTNPFDFDTDGDGLPDGFEIMISGTDPLKAYTTPGITDGMRNFDGDAMAFTTPKLEEQVLPKPLNIEVPFSFALVEAGGDTDGVQWYVSKTMPTNVVVGQTCVTGTVVTAADKTFVTSAKVPVYRDGDELRLAADLPKATTWEVVALESLTNTITCLTNLIEVVETEVTDEESGETVTRLLTNKTDYVAFMPTRIAAGSVVTTNAATFATLEFGGEGVKGVNAAWVYGSKTLPTQTTGDNLANQGGYGMLAVGRYKDAPAQKQLAALPAPDENVAYLHYLVYQEFGFDPRTAWNANTPLAARWGTTVGEGENKEVKGNNYAGNFGYAGIATRTREYTTYDEFLVFSFFLNNGMTVLTYEDLGDRAPSMAELWYANTTNPQGPTEAVNTTGAATDGGTGEGGDSAASEYWGRNDTNGADTDGDGVPDGWELYVMAGPKNPNTGEYVFAMPYLDGYRSSFGPFVPDAASATKTDNSATSGYDSAAGDGDGLTELQEFAGTDSCAWYAQPQGGRKDAFSTTIARPEEHKFWLNKFFPTDPWEKDTDGDSLSDSAEFGKFRYGSDPVDTGKTSIPGGGLNPCAMDTDLDGLPDPWEAQYAGKTIYTGEGAQYAKGTAADGSEVTSSSVTLQGLCDGMDGTVFDAYNSVYVNRTTGTSDATDTKTEVVTVDGVAQVVDRDYDRDGLENWQEYLVGAMRCWRYDDPFSGFGYIASDLYFDPLGNFSPNYEALGIETEGRSPKDVSDEFWYETLFNKTGRIYNPHLVTDQSSGAQYFTRVRNGFDPAFREAGTYYLFYDRAGWNPDGTPTMLGDLWGVQGYGLLSGPAPKKYISCDPTKSDTDQDGMDDYYELFHGMNPLLGADNTRATSHGGCDIVYDAWYDENFGSFKYPNGDQVNGAPCRALANLWIAKGGQRTGFDENHMDFVKFPWLNGLETADPDGDDIRNQAESIMAKVAPTSVFLHTDPTPLWMTDSSYTNSLVYRFFRLPTNFSTVFVPESIRHGEEVIPLYTCDGYMMTMFGPVLAPFLPDYWQVAAEETQNWIASFEENEGYDSDHDALSDQEEFKGNLRGASDPQDFDSPHRRQAMYFPGKDAALQSMPFVAEDHPRYAVGYPDDMSFLQYTVECWVRPESAADATVIERGVWTSWSNPGDQELLRKNFQVAVKNGKWYTKFDSGTLAGGCVEVQSQADVEVGKWTHVAATYDAEKLILYVNGAEAGKKGFDGKGLIPEYGSSAVVVHPGEGTFTTNGYWGGRANGYWFDKEYSLHAFLIGASFKGIQDLGGIHTSHLNVLNGAGWNRYKDFFKGYIDEVRVWDGARSSLDIKADMKVRYTAALAKANREDFYDQWAAGKYRYDKDGNAKDYEVIPELRYHWSFDSVPGAANAEMAAKVPLGYAAGGVKAPLSRPDDWTIGWWSKVLAGYGSVYSDPTWVTWVPNTVTHLPRFDGTTLDSFYWSDDFMGDTAEKNNFARTAEPVSRWTQYVRNGLTGGAGDTGGLDFESTGRRFWLANVRGTNEVSNLAILFEFTGRHLNQQGDDLLPLGGAFAKYCDDMWDEQGPSMPWEVTGEDGNGNGLPDWWEEYAKENYLLDPADADNMKWTTPVDYNGRRMTAGQAYLYDLNRGLYADKDGNVKTGDATFAQKADEDKDGIPDWWEELHEIHNGTTDLTAGGHADDDPDNDGLSNYQEYLASTVYGFYDLLNPVSARSGVTNQKVTDYFLPITNDFPLTFNGRTFEEPRNFMRGEYLGAVLTDHDFMENWWENKYGKNYTSAWIYDPWDDTDGDGWSNFAECRAFMWGGAVASDIIDRWLDGNVTEAANHLLDYPRPAIGVKITYANDQINDIDGKGLVVRTKTTGKRVDATFVIHGTDAETIEAQDHIIGSFYDRVTIHGFLNPGWLLENDVKLFMAQISAADLYTWRVYKTYEAYKNNSLDPDDYWEYSGTYADYRASKRSHQWVRLISPEIDWGDPIAMVHSDKDAHFGELLYTGEEGSSATIGTVDFYTGEYTLDLNKLRSIDSRAENSIFKFAYSYKIGKNWPQTLWLSDTFDDAGAEDERTGNFVNGSGRVREGLNTIEAFIDYNNNGRYDAGEPYGMVKDVPVGWHKVPEVTIELTDQSLIVPRTLIPAASTSTGDDQFGAGQQAAAADKDGEDGATTMTKVRIVRDSINGIPSSWIVSKHEFVMDDRAYLTEADVMSAASPDLDWNRLTVDADRLGIKNIASATYHIESYGDSADDSTVTPIGAPFTRQFSNARPVVAPVSPLADAPVYTAAPTFRFTADRDTTAFAVQVADENGTVIYDSGVRMLGGRASVTVGNYAYSFTAPIYANASIVTNGAPVLVDGRTYKWRVVAFNAKFTTAEPSDYCAWTDFQMDVGNANRYPVSQTTGYGKVGAIVRYFGPAKTNDLTNLVVVEAFGNADFTGQALAQIRVADLADISDVCARIDKRENVNAVLGGLDIGTVYLRAYIDLNNNGKWDRYEPWGYANMVGEYGTDYSYPPIYNPKAIAVDASAYAWENPNFTTIFIEDTDLDKNEIPDCLEEWPETVASDWWTWAGTQEDHLEYAVAGDVMAYAEVDRVMVVFSDGTSALVAKGAKRPTVGDTAVSCNNGHYDSWYRYGDEIGLGLPVTVTDDALTITDVSDVKVLLVHAQVYDEFGYDMKTANPVAFAAGTAVNTKEFTAADKKHLLSYLEAIGFIDAADLPKNTDKILEDYLDELARTDAISASRLWQKYSLKVGDPDQNRDGVADGWQLYVMFGPNGELAASTPWTSAAAARTVTSDGNITWVQEYDGGRYPTDPWNKYTLGDYFTINGVRYDISDKDAYAYHLKHFDGEEGDKYADFDNDGLCNYDEFDIMKNNNRTLDADNMFSYFGSVTVPALAGQCVPDYFLKSTKRNAAASDLAGRTIYDYLGFDYTGADFIESWWKDNYGLARNEFVADFDTDGDGWDNWSEARASTDPTSIAQLGVDNLSLKEYPTPMIDLTVICNESGNPLSKPVILQAWSAGQVGGIPDAMWRSRRSSKGGSGEEKDEDEWGYSYYYSQSQNESNTTDMAGISNGRYLGRWSGKEDQHIHLSPGNITPSRVQIQFKDIAYGIETRQDGYLMEKAVGTVDTAKWLTLVSDVARSDDSTMGDLYFSYQPAPQDTSMGWNSYTQTTQDDLKRVWVGEINYVTGEMTVNFDKINERHYNVVDRWNVGVYYYTRAHIVNPTTSYVQVIYAGSIPEQASPARFYLSSADEASEKSRGHVRQGLNTFIAFADMNENGAYDPGEPFGCVKDVQVGWDKVTDLNIALTTTSPVLPRFDPAALGAVSNETGDVTTEIAAGAPIITDVTPDSKVRIVRWTINGEDCIHRIVLSKTAGDLGVITEADVLSKFRFDLDWDFLVRDAAQLNIEAEDITEVVYAVFVGDTAIDEESINGRIVKRFAANRAKAAPVSPSATRDAVVKVTRPEFAFTVPDGYPAYVFELCDADGKAVFTSTNLVGRRNAAGNETYRPPVFFGWDDAEGVHNLLPNGTYTWRIAMLNAKFRTVAVSATDPAWSAPAAFTVELAKGKVHDTDKGILEVAVRYYGDAPVDADHPIVVQAFKTADFTGVPEGQAIVTNAAVISSYDDTNTVNAVIYGLPEGDYYVLAFGDVTNDCRYSSWETWGYQNRVGTGARDIYTPVAAHVGKNVTSKALVFIEDIDGNNNEIPDWMEGFPADDGRAGPNDGFDTDGDGMSDDDEEAYGTDPDDADSDDDGVPDGAEIWGGTDPLTPDADFALPGDMMACEDIKDVLLVRIGTSKENSAWYAVMDLANEGWKLRDSDIPLQTPATEIASLVTTWKMGTYTGIGTNVTFTGDEKVLETRFSDIRLIHAQVYAKNGYETGCAAMCLNEGNDPRLVDGIASAEHPHTKPFTALDKYLVCRYLEAIGVEGFNEKEMNAKGLWSQMMLKADEIDNDRDDIADSWELYTMFGTTGLKAFTEGKGIAALADLKVSPFNTADGMMLAPGEGSQLKLVEEFDGGYYPTDPWSVDTDNDSVIDYYAYQYHLKGNDAGKDLDGDGLSNYAEYLITEVFQYAECDPEKYATNDGVCDYFKKVGDLYLGEIFTDHDQVGDEWEDGYQTAANRYVYDPDRDDDNDGWSNYAEFRAGTNPSREVTLGADGYTFGEFPIPVVQATVVYNGSHPLKKAIVFKAWNEAKDADMLGSPDAVWSLGTSVSGTDEGTGAPSDSGSALIEYTKYCGHNTGDLRRFNLTGGAIAEGSVRVCFRDNSYVRTGIGSNATEAAGANWYVGVTDKNGRLVDFRSADVGSVDYATGLMEVDFSKLTGSATGTPNSTSEFPSKLIADQAMAGTTGGQYYDTISLDDSAILLKWDAMKIGTRADGTYYLADADAISDEQPSLGHLREGKAVFVCFSDEDGNGKYTVGEPYGFVRGVDVGWQGAKFTVELTEASPVFARVDLYGASDAGSGASGGEGEKATAVMTDRMFYWGTDSGDIPAASYTNLPNEVDAEYGAAQNEYEHVRIVPYLVGGIKTDTAYYDREYAVCYQYVPNRVVAEFDINRTTKPCITEADFIRDGTFDIDWDGFDTEIASMRKIIGAVGDVTAVKYRIVFGKSGPVGRESSLADPTQPVRAFSTLIERRYEPWNKRTKPTQLKTDGVVHGAQPTFKWRLDENTEILGYSLSSSLFGCSYTAFQIEVYNRDTNEKVYDSGLVRAPAKDANGFFTWTAPLYAGDQTDLKAIFAKTGNWKWRVVMNNAKFLPEYNDLGWSAYAEFSTSVNAQQEIGDNGYSSVDVAVKYAGPAEVLAKCAVLSEVKGKVRIQAFTTADFSGEPVAQVYTTDKASIIDTSKLEANATLIGLPANGTYYIRAYIDSNGNRVKDDWESWGYVKEPVVLKGRTTAPEVGLFIEDADTDQDVIPDAYEYAAAGWKDDFEDIRNVLTSFVDDGAKILFTAEAYENLTNGLASLSTGLPGASLTQMMNQWFKDMIEGPGSVELTADEARAMVLERTRLLGNSVRITAFSVDTEKKVAHIYFDGEAQTTTAGEALISKYNLTDLAITVNVKVFMVKTLAEAWPKDPLFTTEAKIQIGKDSVAVDADLTKDAAGNPTNVDFNSGFFKLVVEQK